MKTVLIALMLMGCATAPKTEPSQPQPQKAEKTTIQTILDFFEPRD